jgi:hypothetical protein
VSTIRASYAPRAVAAALTAVALAVCLAGCGSGAKKSASSDSSAPYDLAATKACLAKEPGVQAFLNPGNKAIGGSKGELRVTFGYGRQWIYIAFGRDAKEAQTIENRAIAVTLEHENKGKKIILTRKMVLSGVRVRRNVFYYADGGPVGALEGGKVVRCLSS